MGNQMKDGRMGVICMFLPIYDNNYSEEICISWSLHANLSTVRMSSEGLFYGTAMNLFNRINVSCFKGWYWELILKDIYYLPTIQFIRIWFQRTILLFTTGCSLLGWIFDAKKVFFSHGQINQVQFEIFKKFLP